MPSMIMRLSNTIRWVAFAVLILAGSSLSAQAANAADLGTVQVESYRRIVNHKNSVATYQLTSDSTGQFRLARQVIIGIEPIQNWIGYQKISDYIVFSGATTPGAHVSIRFTSQDQIVVGAAADSKGNWTTTIDVDTLPSGTYQAVLQISSDQINGEEHIASVTVENHETVSNTTWTVVMLAGFSIVLLLIIINLQFLFQRRIHELYSAPPE